MKLLPDHWRKGLIRLYLALAVPWAIMFGYLAYDNHQIYAFNRDYVDAVDAKLGTDRRNYTASASLRDKFHKKRDLDLKLLVVLPIGLPLLILTIAWISAGFRR